MVCRCCVPGCESTGDYDKFSFFTFPSNSERRLKWCRSLGFSPNSVVSRSRVCLLHFKPTDISQGKSDRPEQYRHSRLLKDAVPSKHQVFFEMPEDTSQPSPKKKSRKKKSNIPVVSPPLDDDLSPIDKLIPNSSGMEFLSQIGKLFSDSDDDDETGSANADRQLKLTTSETAWDPAISSSSIDSTSKENDSVSGEPNSDQASLSGAVAYLNSESFKLPDKPAVRKSPRKSKRKRSIPDYKEIDNVTIENDETRQKLKEIRANCRRALMQLADSIDKIKSEEFLGLICNNISSIAMLGKSHIERENEDLVPWSGPSKKNLRFKSKGKPSVSKEKTLKRIPCLRPSLNLTPSSIMGSVGLSQIKLIPISTLPTMQPSTEISDFILKPNSIKEEQQCVLNASKLCPDTSEYSCSIDSIDSTNHNGNYISEFDPNSRIIGMDSQRIDVKEEIIDID